MRICWFTSTKSWRSEKLQELERTLGGESGIYSACVSDKTTHLLMVEYDPEDISAKHILERVHETGIHAEIVGL